MSALPSKMVLMMTIRQRQGHLGCLFSGATVDPHFPKYFHLTPGEVSANSYACVLAVNAIVLTWPQWKFRSVISEDTLCKRNPKNIPSICEYCEILSGENSKQYSNVE